MNAASDTAGPHRFAALGEAELDALIERVREARDHDLALAAADLSLLLDALMTLASVHERLEHDDLTITKLKKLLGLVRSSEKLAGLGALAGAGGDAEADGGATARSRSRRSPPRKKPPVAPPKPTVHHHPIRGLVRGQCCPACARGRLYKYAPAEFTRIIGHAPYSAERHVSEQLRCNGCGEIHRAELPEAVLADGAAGQQYGYSARAVMAIAKYFDADPFFRQHTVQGLFGLSLSASTIFDQCEHLADALNPVYRALQRAVAASAVFHIDDTTHRILEAKPVTRRRGKVERTRSGVYASALLGTMRDEGGGSDRPIVLYRTNIGHAGEWLEEVLAHRPPGLEAPIVMSDALASNRVHGHEVRAAACNAHARRGFVEVATHYPEPARFALETYQRIWVNDSHCRAHRLDPEARLAYHRAHSAEPMQRLRTWCEGQLESEAVEANATLGQAMGYFLRHHDRLTLFLREPGAPLDNNDIERLLKLVVRARKNSGFYRSEVGAGVSDVITSVLGTCHENGINAFDYLCAVQRHASEVRREPERWLPWNWPGAAKAALETAAAMSAA